ncbi:MAG TPA: hypothetical protein VMZ04_01970, partial [Anaerolineae bacterium]|nr:hypothetical protein [Anaerolineae bacterium]
IKSGCTTCGSCHRASRFDHPDLHILFPYKAQPETVKDYKKWLEGFLDHRKLLAKEQYAPVIYEKGRQIVVGLVNEIYTLLYESSYEGGHKVCVILLADRLNGKTANSLLKILEEPPDRVHFILTTERLSSVLPTIVSRASVIRFRRIKINEIETYLERLGVTDTAKRHVFASAGEGSIKTAKAYAFNEKVTIRSKSFEMYRSIAEGSVDNVVSSAFSFMWSRDTIQTEEMINSFAECTKSVLETKVGMKIEDGAYTSLFEMLARSTDVPSLHLLSKKLEEGLNMLERNVSVSMVLTTIFYEIQDAYRKKQQGQQRNHCL